MIELTALLRETPDGDRLGNWPAGMRIITRRERPHPGAQLSLFEEADGWRYQLFATNTPATTRGRPGADRVPGSPLPRPGEGRDCIRNAKNTGLNHLPSKHPPINQAWLAATANRL